MMMFLFVIAGATNSKSKIYLDESKHKMFEKQINNWIMKHLEMLKIAQEINNAD